MRVKKHGCFVDFKGRFTPDTATKAGKAPHVRRTWGCSVSGLFEDRVEAILLIDGLDLGPSLNREEDR